MVDGNFMSAIGRHTCRSVRLSLAIQLSGKAHEDSDHTIMITDALCTHNLHGGEVVAAVMMFFVSTIAHFKWTNAREEP